MTLPPSWNACAVCNEPATSRSAKYCAEHRDEGRKNARAATAEWNRQQWRLRQAGTIPDPTHGGAAAEKRGAAIGQSNREQPRKRKATVAPIKKTARVKLTAAERKARFAGAADA